MNRDLSKIQCDFKIVCKGGLELGEFCKGKDIIHDGCLGLTAICEMVLEHSLNKDETIRLGNQDALELTETQVQYTALNAWAFLKVFEEVDAHSIIRMHVSQPTANDEGIGFVVKKFHDIFITYNYDNPTLLIIIIII